MQFKFDQQQEIKIRLTPEVFLHGNLFVPSNAKSIVIFAHGSGSGRLSPRNQYVANALNQKNFATLLFDLLTSKEDNVDQITAEYRFNIPLLAERLVKVTQWLTKQNTELKIAYFGASTGAAAALIAAAKLTDGITTIISRGGRPDLAGDFLSQVTAPTLLIVGGLDYQVIELNEFAKSQMQTSCEIKIVPGATHLFEEPGKLDEVIKIVIKWLEKYL